MEVVQKFKEDWKITFPGDTVPDLSFLKSKLSVEKESVECQKRIIELRSQLKKEEFILHRLDEIQNDKGTFKKPLFSVSSDDKISDGGKADNLAMGHLDGTNKEEEDNVFSVKLVLNVDDPSDSIQSTFSSFKPGTASPRRSLSKSSLIEVGGAETMSLSIQSIDVGQKVHQKSLSMDENQLKTIVSPYSGPTSRRLTDPTPQQEDEPKPKPRPAPRTLPRGKKAPLPPPPIDKNRSVSLTDVSLQNKNFVISPNNKTKSMNLEDLNMTPNLLNQNMTTGVMVFTEEEPFVDPYQDDEHIYTDINELNIQKAHIPTPELEEEPEIVKPSKNRESPYENAIMKPRLEKIIDNSSIDDSTLDSDNSMKHQHPKRLGSQDRQAIIMPDEDENSLVSQEEKVIVDTDEVIIIPSHENMTDGYDDDLENKNTEFDSSFDIIEDMDSDDEEHIYANVEEFRIYRKESDEDDEKDLLNESISSALPPPYFTTEMTSDQIQSMLIKIQESDSEDCLHSDSDEGSTESIVKNKAFRSRLDSNSEIIRPTNRNVSNTAGNVERTASTPLKQKEGIKPPKTSRSTEVSEEFKASRMRQHLVNNLRDSEKCYLDCLEMLTKFMKPLHVSTKSSQPILSEAEFKSIFHKTDEMLLLHQDFFAQLEPRIENWNDGQLIGDLFIMIMHGFDLYLGYVGNYKTAKDTISKCRHANHQFASIMDQDIRIPSLKDPLKLEGLLYKPVDRVTQYSLILNDLLKYTSPDHPDHPLIVEVSGALFDLFEQVNVDSSKKKRRQRQLLKETSVVEVDDGERRQRSLILFNDVIISAKLKPSKDAYVCKWYASLCDINIKPYPNSESPSVVPVSSKVECDKIRANIANMRQEVRREYMPLQQVVSTNASDASPPFIKRWNASGPRSSSRGMERVKKKIAEQERLLLLISPSIQLSLFHRNGKCYTMLVSVEAERQAWTEALKPRLKRIHARNPPSIQLSSLELQQAFETVLQVQRLGQRFGSQMPSPFFGPTRPLSVDFSLFEYDKESLTGYLYVNLHSGKGFSRNSDTYVVLEMDSYGHFFRKAKTKALRGSDPQWEESFEFEIEACNTLRLSCFNKLRLMGDDISGKCSINLTKENLTDNRNHTLVVSLDRGQTTLKISLSFSTSIDGIKKSPSFSDHGVFGVPIMVVCKRENFHIPVIVISCIKEIEKRGMDELGIYRLSGIASEIQNLKKFFNEQTQNALLALADTDIHAVAGLLKLYFRELPQSLFTSKLYRKFVAGLSITDSEEKEMYMLDILHQLPKCNKITALYLFEHLRRVVLLESQNKMGVNNLATVFGPTVLRPPSSNNDKDDERSSCNVGTFDIGALDVMSQVGIFRYFLGMKNNERVKLPEDDLELWQRLDPEKASALQLKMMREATEEHLI